MRYSKTPLTCFLVLAGLFLSSCAVDRDDLFYDSNPFQNFDEDGSPQLSRTSELLVVIPDTQLYIVNKESHIYLEKLMDRILEIHNAGFKIKAVLQVGDITDRNTREEWQSAARIFSVLDQKIDYILCTGNHDYGEDGSSNNRKTMYNEYFHYKNNSSFVISHQKDKYENTYFQFDIQGVPFQLFSLEFGPRDQVVSWADSIAKQNGNRKGILLTHAYLSRELKRYDFSQYGLSQSISPYAYASGNPEFKEGNVNDGQQLWDKLVNNNNFSFIICGHRNAMGSLISPNANQQDVLQMVFAEHRIPEALEGWVQILEFYDDQKTVGVKTYSTHSNIWKTDSIHQYDFLYR